jgi:tetratricopeptide (TPR) repeat protein
MAVGKSSRGRPAAEDTPAFGGIAEKYRRAGDLDRAIALCREGLKKFPDHVSARVTLGWALLDQKKYEEAQVELESALKRAPDNLAAIRGLAELHERAENDVHLPMDGPGQWPPDESMIANAVSAAVEPVDEPAGVEPVAAAGAETTPAAIAATPAAVEDDSLAAAVEIEPPAAAAAAVSGSAYDTTPAVYTRASQHDEERRPESGTATIDIDPPMSAGSAEEAAAAVDVYAAYGMEAPDPTPVAPAAEPVAVEPILDAALAEAELEEVALAEAAVAEAVRAAETPMVTALSNAADPLADAAQALAELAELDRDALDPPVPAVQVTAVLADEAPEIQLSAADVEFDMPAAEPALVDDLAPIEIPASEPPIAEAAHSEPELAEPEFGEAALAEPAFAEPALAEPALVEPAFAEPDVQVETASAALAEADIDAAAADIRAATPAVDPEPADTYLDVEPLVAAMPVVADYAAPESAIDLAEAMPAQAADLAPDVPVVHVPPAAPLPDRAEHIPVLAAAA